MTNGLVTATATLGLFFLGVEPVPANGAHMLIELAAQWGPLGLFALALWHILAARDKMIERLQDELKLIRDQARDDVKTLVAAIERGTASNERLATSIRELTEGQQEIVERIKK